MNQLLDVCSMFCTAVDIVSMNDGDEVIAMTVELAAPSAIVVIVVVLNTDTIEANSCSVAT